MANISCWDRLLINPICNWNYLICKESRLIYCPNLFILIYGLSQFFVGIFPSPNPLHNVFGLTMIVGYFSPLMFPLLWKNKLGIRFKVISIIAFILIVLGIFLNLTPAFAPTLYPLEYYGIVQRFLLYTFYLYCIIIFNCNDLSA